MGNHWITAKQAVAVRRSMKRANSLESRVQEARERLADVWARATESTPATSPGLGDALHDLSAAVEALGAVAVELRARNDQLVRTDQLVDDDRRRYRELFDDVPVAYVVTDPWGVIQEANHRAGKLLGVAAAALEGLTFARFVPRDRFEELVQVVRAVRQGDERRRWDTLVQPLGGRTQREVEADVSPARDDEGDVIGICWLLHDVTQQREIERRARFVERVALAVADATSLAAAFDVFSSMAVDVASHDRASLWLSDEDQFRIVATSGPRRDEVQPGTLVRLSGDLLREARSIDHAMIGYTADARSAVLERFRAAGIQSWVTVPVRAGGRTVALINFSSDRRRAYDVVDLHLLEMLANGVAGTLTTLLALEDERQAVEHFRELDETKTEILEMVSHDVRLPLTVITGFAETLRQRWLELGDEEKLEYLDRVSNNADRLRRLVQRVLDMSRIESGLADPDRTLVDVAALVQGLADDLALDAGSRNVRVVAEDVPPVLADRGMIEEALTNLMSNALKYSPPDAAVDLVVRRSGEDVAVDVRDRGPGIAPEDAPSVFQRYSRLPGAEGASKPGHGLGLYICRSLVEANGGRIELDSAPGRGSTFSVLLPAASVQPGLQTDDQQPE